ncbi:Putative membrane-associated, eicosanoid/glutathione metabolism (MAPEG) protein [Colletotrichum destructivum]|uniref:Membrane-associated, eicosanoid/glutathione metabolism (MAPEG) protein n=1 Tax=Colletotrichum destructivum TaxID=34406 RepID=A0AAX4I224_9PEZI|nr:Putative membrane-associated, eicosanoid/glutathione metabolism (MAPEG) protein [Colletotrichum destructivum]
MNISYFTIPPALVLALFGRLYSGILGPGKMLFDRNNPRGFPETIKNAELDEKTRGRLLRAEACSANGFEGLPLFAAAVTAGNSAGVSALTMNVLSLAWLASRVLYIFVYIWYQETEKLALGQAPLRFKIWSVGAMLCMSMFVLAGLKS